MLITAYDLDTKIQKALSSGPKTIIAIKLYLEEREKELVSEYQVLSSLDALIAAGLCEAADLDLLSGLNALDSRPRVGPAMLYSLAQK